MFVSKKKYEYKLTRLEIDKTRLENSIEMYKGQLRYLRSIIDDNECEHKFGDWKQSKIEGMYGDLNGMKVVSYRDKQVRKCKKCGFMESSEI